MKKNIRKAIIETQEKKERLLIEREIVELRFKSVLSGINSEKDFHRLSENKKIKLLFSIADEYNSVKNNIVSEQFDLMGFLKSLLPFLGSGVETIAEPFVDRVLSSLGLGGYFKNFLISIITTNPAKFFEALKDCEKLTVLIAESLAEAFVMGKQTQLGVGGFFFDLLRNILGKEISKIDFVENIKNFIGDKICALFSKFSGNAQNLLQGAIAKTT